MALIRVAAGAHLIDKKLGAPQIRYVLTGTVACGDREYPPGSCLWVPAGVPAPPLGSDTGAELFTVSLPRYAP